MVVKGFSSLIRKAKTLVFIFGMLAVLGGHFVFAAEQDSAYKLRRYRVFPLRHISAEQGKDYLAQAGIGTASQLPGANTLLVTAEPADLIKASAILNLVDAEEKFYIKAILPASEAANLPSNKQIAAEVSSTSSLPIGNISIGTFSSPPSTDASVKSIIDIHGDTVLAIAPVNQLERITSAIERLRAGQKDIEGSEAITEPTEANKPQEFSDELLNSLAEAEKAAAELEATGPAESNVAALLQQQSVRTPEEKEPNLPAATESIEPEVAGAEPQMPSELEPEQPAVETEEPQEEKAPEETARVQPYEPKPLSTGEEVLELDLPEKLNVIDLLDLVGKYLHLDYMYDEGALVGKEVSLRLQGPIKVRDLYPLVESVLKFRGFVMTRKGNLVTIVTTEEALDIDPALQPERGEIQFGDVIITRVFALKHIDTASATNLLTGLKVAVNITPIAETGTIIVTGYAYRMARIEEILNMVDKPGVPRQFRFKQLRYTMAQTLAPKVKTLIEQLGTVSVTIAGPQIIEPPPPRGRRAAPARPAPPVAEPSARPMVYLDADERTNRVLMIGFENELDIVEGLINALDVEQQDLRFLRLYEIQNVGADEVVKKLQELGIAGAGQQKPSPRITAGEQPQPPTPAGIGAAGGEPQEVLAEEPQVVIIEATNSLLVNATPQQHAQIAMIIGYVDSKTLEEAIPYAIYGLENQDPEDLANVLNQLIQETIKDKEGKIEKVIKTTEDEIIIIPDKNTFSLIVYASKKNQEWIATLIKQLDKRRPQVLIDVSLVEVTRTDDFSYDLDVLSAFPDLTTTTTLLSGDVVLPPNATGGGRDRFIELRGNADGSGTGFYADKHINILLTAMQTKGYGRVLAKPKILVNDGQPGTIKTTQTTNVKIEQIIIPEEGTQRTTTSFQPYNAGITLTITPNISEGDLLLLEVEMDRTDFQEVPAEGVPPDTTASNIKTVVTVPNNRTIILGGLLRLNQGKGGTKVPLIGDIPLVGGLFRSTSNTTDDSQLYIFVKANILRPDDALAGLPEAEKISQENKIAFEKAEREFQEYQDWPGIKPKSTQPAKALEAQ